MTTENGCLTPTLKIKRCVLDLRRLSVSAWYSCLTKLMLPHVRVRRKETYTFFKEPLDALYALGDPSGGSTMKL